MKNSYVDFPFYDVFPLLYALYDKNDPDGISVDHIRIQNIYCYILSKLLIVVVLKPSVKIEKKQFLHPSIMIVYSKFESFEDCMILQPDDLSKRIPFTGSVLFISITGTNDAAISMLKIIPHENSKKKGERYESNVVTNTSKTGFPQ